MWLGLQSSMSLCGGGVHEANHVSLPLHCFTLVHSGRRGRTSARRAIAPKTNVHIPLLFKT